LRGATTSAASTAAGHTFTHMPTVSSTAARRGRVAAQSMPVSARGTVTASIRPSAIGPSSARKASHHHAAIRRVRESRRVPSRMAKAAASSSTTIASHVCPYQAEPNASAAAIGPNARIGYTHGTSMPMRT
jgi:hypothetical protein